jgi:DNA-binding NtrC family response regulator
LAKKILVVDDELLIRWSLIEALSKEGYEVKAAANGSKALDDLHREEFDFILTDLRMSGIDGWEVLAKAKELYPQAKVVIITAYGSQNTETEAWEKGAYAYIEKPEIIDKVKRLLKKIPDNCHS